MNQRSDAPASHLEALEQRALEECNNEPIETPGFIQEGGALLACAFEDLRICYASENIADFFPYTLSEILDLGVQSVQHITAFDQVMAYRFLADESGEVMAEAVAPELRAYKGLRFPTYSKQNCLLLTSRYVGKAKSYNYQHK